MFILEKRKEKHCLIAMAGSPIEHYLEMFLFSLDLRLKNIHDLTFGSNRSLGCVNKFIDNENSCSGDGYSMLEYHMTYFKRNMANAWQVILQVRSMKLLLGFLKKVSW